MSDLGRAKQPQLAVNYVPIAFTATAFEGELVPYESREQPTALRSRRRPPLRDRDMLDR